MPDYLLQLVFLLLQLLASGAVGAAVAALLMWLGKEWISEKLKNAIKSEYDVKLETHKAQLKATSDVELEKLRSQLSQVARERDVVFSRLHEKRADAIAEIYAGLRRVQHLLAEYVKAVEFSGEPSREERGKSLADAHDKYLETYMAKFIYLPKAIAEKVDEINRQVVQAGNLFTIMVRNTQGGNPAKFWEEVEHRVSKIIPEALRELEIELRRLLGDKADDR